MKLTLHDVLLPVAGDPGPGPRPPIPEELRSRWVKAMHELLTEAGGDGRCFARDFETAVGKLNLKGFRCGRGVAAVWAAGAEETVVAATLLLAGDSAAADEAAAAALKALWPASKLTEQDLRGAGAQGRPCLATFYCDARWYDNARVELAATALALAVLFGPQGSLKVKDESAAPAKPSPKAPPVPQPGRQPGPAPQPERKPEPGAGPWFVEPEKPLLFDFTRERLGLVMEMVTKKANAAAERLPGLHFRVYPPRDYLARPNVISGRDVFRQLQHTQWLVFWHDGRRDRLGFGEFLGFLDQLAEIERAYHATTAQAKPVTGRPQNLSVWAADPGSGRNGPRAVKVRATLRTRELVTDENIRRLMATVMLEPVSQPHEAATPPAAVA
jgi:hypothetical protein